MITKLKQKVRKYKDDLILPILGVLSLSSVIFLSYPLISKAACTGFGSPFSCDSSTIILTSSSATVKVGDPVTFTVKLNNNTGLDKLLGSNPFSQQMTVSVYASIGSANALIASKSLSANSAGTIVLDPVIVGGVWAKTDGTYKIYASVDLGTNAADPGIAPITYALTGPDVQITVTGNSSTGPASLVISQISKGLNPLANNSNVLVSFSFSFSAGTPPKNVSQFLYYCQYDNNQSTGFQTLSSDSRNFSCQYPTTAQNYSVFVKALDDSNPAKTIVAGAPFTVNITGNEVSQGAQTLTPGGGINPLDAVSTFINQVIGVIVSFIQGFLYLIFSVFIAPLISALLSIHPYKDSFVAVIYPGWIVVRNVCNIFFILALIIIAMATLFRVESYQYKHLIVQLIIAALLINFSLVIAQAILGLADTVQAQFLGNNTTAINTLAKNLLVNNNSILVNNSYINNGPNNNSGAINNSIFLGTFQNIFWLALTIGSFCVFLAIAVFLCIRIVALWILLLISPIAYACGVLPSTASYRSTWWQNFLKYAFFTPIMAFFLNLTVVMVSNAKNNAVLQDIANSAGVTSSAGIANLIIQIGSNILILIFLIAALKVADQAGVYGASGITAWAQKGIFSPFAAAGFLAKAGAGSIKKRYDKNTAGLATGKLLGSEWLSRQAFKVAQPGVFIAGLREESKKEGELYKGRVGAAATLVARKQLGWRRQTESPLFLFDEHEGKKLFEEEEGEWSNNEQIAIGVMNRLAVDAKKGDLRASTKFKHSLLEAFKNRNLNEALNGDNGLALNLFGKKLNYNSNNLRYFFQQLMKEGYIDKDFAVEFMKKLSKDGYDGGDFNGVELVFNDPKTNHPHMIEMEAPDAKGNSHPAGWAGYLEKRAKLIDQADKEGRESAPEGATDEQVGLSISKRLKELEDGYVKESHDHGYENSMHADRARMYMKINMSKKTGSEQLRMFHDSIINVGVEDGAAQISDAGEEVIGEMDAGKVYAMARDNMPKKTRDKFMMYIDKISKSEAGRLEAGEELKKIIRSNARVAGVKMSDAAVEKKMASQLNLWLAAGYSIKSSQAGAAVMKSFFEPKSAKDGGDGKKKTPEQIQRDLIEAIQLYNDSPTSAEPEEDE